MRQEFFCVAIANKRDKDEPISYIYGRKGAAQQPKDTAGCGEGGRLHAEPYREGAEEKRSGHSALPRGVPDFDLLAQSLGIVVSREIILARILGLESEISSNNIDSYEKIPFQYSPITSKRKATKRNRTRENLLKYCGLDTLSMVKVWKN